MTGNFELRNIYSSFHPITYRNVHKLCHVSSYILSGAFLVCAVCGVQQAMDKTKQSSEQHSQNLNLISRK